jgi:alkylhydroperoxidase/carboxymuconolactone decarboxylase family protein YurZ
MGGIFALLSKETRMNAPSSYKQSVTVPLPSDGEIRGVIGEDYNPDTTLNVIKMFAGTGEFYPALVDMVRTIFGTPDIDDKHREMIILRAASILDVPYEWQANVVMAANAGLTETEIEATTSDGPVSGVAPSYVVICTATDDLLGTGTLTDGTLAAMLDMFGPVVTRKYIVTISWFSMLSLFLNGTRTPLEAIDKIGSRTSPLG